MGYWASILMLQKVIYLNFIIIILIFKIIIYIKIYLINFFKFDVFYIYSSDKKIFKFKIYLKLYFYFIGTYATNWILFNNSKGEEEARFRIYFWKHEDLSVY